MLEVSSSVLWNRQNWVLGVPPSLVLQEQWQITTRSLLPSQHWQKFFLGFAWRASSLFWTNWAAEGRPRTELCLLCMGAAGKAHALTVQTYSPECPRRHHCSLIPTHTHTYTQGNTPRNLMSHMATAGEHQEKQALKPSWGTQSAKVNGQTSQWHPGWGVEPARLSTVRQPASQRCLRAPPACLMAAPQQRLSPPQPNRHPDPQPNHHADVRAWGAATPLISAH